MSSSNPNTRNRILKSSLALLEASQGKGVPMSAIAKDAGITRQALYLHFATRAELLIATTYYLDEIKGTDERLRASRSATGGRERLDAYIEAWGDYIPEVHPMAKALLVMAESDVAAANAWNERMNDMRSGCKAAIDALARDGDLADSSSPELATDMLWMLLSVHNWEHLRLKCGWSQSEYIDRIKAIARKTFVAG